MYIVQGTTARVPQNTHTHTHIHTHVSGTLHTLSTPPTLSQSSKCCCFSLASCRSVTMPSICTCVFVRVRRGAGTARLGCVARLNEPQAAIGCARQW